MLITATEVRAFAKTGEPRMNVPKSAIVTPSAWDEAKDCGITIELTTEAPESKNWADKPVLGSGEINQDFLARVVSEVIACLQNTKTIPEPMEVAPSGLKRLRGDRMVFTGAVTGKNEDNIKSCDLFATSAGAKYATRILTLTDVSFSRELESDETLHVLEGTLDCTVNGTKFSGVAGDSFFLPAHRTVTLTTPTRAKLFAVTAALC